MYKMPEIEKKYIRDLYFRLIDIHSELLEIESIKAIKSELSDREKNLRTSFNILCSDIKQWLKNNGIDSK